MIELIFLLSTQCTPTLPLISLPTVQRNSKIFLYEWVCVHNISLSLTHTHTHTHTQTFHVYLISYLQTHTITFDIYAHLQSCSCCKVNSDMWIIWFQTNKLFTQFPQFLCCSRILNSTWQEVFLQDKPGSYLRACQLNSHTLQIHTDELFSKWITNYSALQVKG